MTVSWLYVLNNPQMEDFLILYPVCFAFEQMTAGIAFSEWSSSSSSVVEFLMHIYADFG